MEYTNNLLVSNFLQRDLTENEIAYLAVVIPAVRKWIDKRLSTTFVKKTDHETRYFDGGNAGLDIDPCVSITAVKSISNDGADSLTYTEGTEYILEPQNETVKREIRRRYGCWPHGAKRIAVTAIFSEYDSGVPEDITIMATRLAAGIINTGKNVSDGGNVTSESLEGHSVSYAPNTNTVEGLTTSDPTVMAILKQRDELFIDDYDTELGPGYED